jgi:hypothetical protein
MSYATGDRGGRAQRRVTRIFFVLAFVPMFFVLPYLRGINNPNEYVRVFTVMSIVEQKTFSIDTEVQTFGWVNDMARVKKEDGQLHYYMVKAPGSVYAAVPGYFLFTKISGLFGRHFPSATAPNEQRLAWLQWSTWACRIFAVQLPCFVFLVWFERFLRRFSGDVSFRLSAVAAAGLGTNYLAYVHMFASHALYAVFSFTAFAIAVEALADSRGDPKRRRPSRAFWCGWFASACVMFEYHALFVVVLLCVFGIIVFRKWRAALAFCLGGAMNVPLVMYFQWRAYGNPLTPGHQMLESTKFAAEHQTGLWGVVWPTWEHVTALSFDPGFGLFGMSPFLALGLLAFPFGLLWPSGSTRRARRVVRVASFVWLVCMATLLAVNAGIIEWRAGWSVGPRYQGAAPPFYAFGAVVALEAISRRVRGAREPLRALAGGLALASVVTIGTVGILFDTLPEVIVRPFVQVAIPMIRTGFVPHHLAEPLGWTSTTPWYIALGCLLAAPLVAGLALPRLRPAYASRVVVLAAVFVTGMIPAFSVPEGADAIHVPNEVPWFMAMWEPAGRDRITLLRAEAERYGARRPCLWYKVADLERSANLPQQATQDEQRARGADRRSCPRLFF